MFSGRFSGSASLAALSLLFSALPAKAYQVSPMIYDLKVSGSGASTMIRVQNDEGKPITIEVVAERRDFDENGKETRTPADSEFVLFPPQAVIAAGKTQAVRVQYVGAAKLDKSAMYVITIKQVPVELPASGPSGVQFVFNFGTVANVVPDGAKADIQIASVTPAANGGLQLRVRNNGNKYANLAVGGVALTSGGQTVPISGDVWRNALGSSWLLPGRERLITLPAQGALSGAVTGRFDASLSDKK